MFTKQRFIAYCCNFILPLEAASKQASSSLLLAFASMVFAASNQRNRNSVKGIFMYEKFNALKSYLSSHAE
jgi:hypothetical protein